MSLLERLQTLQEQIEMKLAPSCTNCGQKILGRGEPIKFIDLSLGRNKFEWDVTLQEVTYESGSKKVQISRSKTVVPSGNFISIAFVKADICSRCAPTSLNINDFIQQHINNG